MTNREGTNAPEISGGAKTATSTGTFAAEHANVLQVAGPIEASVEMSKFHGALKSMPKAGNGQGFNDDALPRAARLAKLAGLAQEEAIQSILATQSGAKRDPEPEVRSTVERIYADDAGNSSSRKKKPMFEPFEEALVEQILKEEQKTVADLVRLSPEQNLEKYVPFDFLKHLLPGGPLITVGKKVQIVNAANETVETYHCDTFLLSENTADRVNASEYFVPSPAMRRKGTAKDDGSPSSHSENMYGPRHYIDIESDRVSKDASASVLLHLSKFAPLMMVVDSGGKSLHGYFDCEGVPEADLKAFFNYAHRLGADPKMWAVMQLARLPNGTRLGGARQQALYWDPRAKGRKWDLTGLPGVSIKVRSIFDIPDEEPEESNLLGDRFLCRGKGVLVVGPTGIGKSMYGMQAAMLFALGRDLFGLKPLRPQRVLIVQAENDAQDMRQMVSGVVEGANLTQEEAATVAQNVFYATVNGVGNWMEQLEPHLKRLHPDVLLIDPLFAFFRGSVTDQEKMSQFLREKLQPFLEKHDMGLLLFHHVNKPPGSKKDRADWSGGDFAYAGSGTAEIANWCKGVIAFRNIGDRHVFELVVGKRHKRAGVTGNDGKVADRILIKHSSTPGVMYWERANEDEGVSAAERENLAALGAAYQKLEAKGQATVKAIAAEMGVHVRTVNRMFAGKESVEISLGGERKLSLSRNAGIVSGCKSGGGGGVTASLVAKCPKESGQGQTKDIEGQVPPQARDTGTPPL